MALPQFRQAFSTDSWRVFMVSTSRNFESSLATFLPIWLRHLDEAIGDHTASSEDPHPDTRPHASSSVRSIHSHFAAAALEYFESHRDLFASRAVADLLYDSLLLEAYHEVHVHGALHGLGMLSAVYGDCRMPSVPLAAFFPHTRPHPTVDVGSLPVFAPTPPPNYTPAPPLVVEAPAAPRLAAPTSVAAVAPGDGPEAAAQPIEDAVDSDGRPDGHVVPAHPMVASTAGDNPQTSSQPMEEGAVV